MPGEASTSAGAGSLAKRIVWMPSQTRYAAPTSLTVVYAVADATSSAERPTARATPCTHTPVRLPAIVRCASRVPPRSTWRVISAMSAPGIIVTRTEPSRKGRSCSGVIGIGQGWHSRRCQTRRGERLVAVQEVLLADDQAAPEREELKDRLADRHAAARPMTGLAGR